MVGRSVAACAGVSPGLALACGVAVAAVAAGPAGAQARSAHQGHGSVFSSRGRPEIAPTVARYVAADDRAFVLDRTGGAALLKFEDSAEVWVLRPAPGPGGDVIYRDDLGRQMIRASSKLGGLTVFPIDRPAGLPAALAGHGVSLRPAAISPNALFHHFARQGFRVFKETRRRLVFETVEDATPGTSTLLADAATVAAEALTRFKSRKGERGRTNGLRTVQFSTGARAGAVVTGPSLVITVAPNQGLAGRPSSERIVRTLAAAD